MHLESIALRVTKITSGIRKAGAKQTLRMAINSTTNVSRILTLAAVWFLIGTGIRQLNAIQNVFSPGMVQTVQYILNLVNTESGATKSLGTGETRWTYSMSVADPCTLKLTEELQTLNSAVPNGSTAPVREITNYLIPAADLDFGKFGTRLKLEPPGVMRFIISTERATMRRWQGVSAAMPQNAPVEYEVPVRFGKPNVDIFDVPVRLENALKHLASLCRVEAPPDTDPFRPR